jgi:hypothetical protein
MYAGLVEASAGADGALVGAMLQAFDGNVTPALRRDDVWIPARGIPRGVAYAAHLGGCAFAGAYPFRGTNPACGCLDIHTCDGRGANYACWDLDAHNGETDIYDRLVSLLAVMERRSLRPWTFTSAGGHGIHVFAFLDRHATTPQIHASGVTVLREAGIRERADVIPSARHGTGLGTLHALPLHPAAAEAGGGVMLDTRLQPLPRGDVVDALREAAARRSPLAGLLASAIPAPPGSPPVAQPQRRRPRGRPKKPRTDPVGHGPGLPCVLASMRVAHPQFQRAMAADLETWPGGRSAWEATVAFMLRRQGASTDEIAAFLAVYGPKSAERGSNFARMVAAYASPSRAAAQQVFAGMPRRAVRGATPWCHRTPPPLSYGDAPNPWWDSHTRQYLASARTASVDGPVLAYLVDRWHSGITQGGEYYLGMRTLAADLGLSPSVVFRSVRRLAEALPWLAVTPGVRHAAIRVATSYDITGLRPGRDGQQVLCSGRDHDDRGTGEGHPRGDVRDRHADSADGAV